MSSQHCPLESLPTELKLAILSKLDFFRSLRNFVHASPAYHKTYRKARNEILTIAVINELRTRGITFVDPVSIVDVKSAVKERNAKYLEQALQLIYDHLSDARKNKRLALNMPQCLALSTVSKIRPLSSETKTDSEGNEILVCDVLGGPFFDRKHGNDRYHVVTCTDLEIRYFYGDREGARVPSSYVNEHLTVTEMRHCFSGVSEFVRAR